MKNIIGIINSQFEPPTNTLWLKGHSARYYNNGEWVTIGIDTELGYAELESKVDTLDKEVGKLETSLNSIISVPTGGTNGQVLKRTTSGYTWANDNNTTYNPVTTTANGLMTKEDKAKLDTLENYTLQAATKTSLGGIKAGTNIATLGGDADLATVIGTVNSIIEQLRTCGVLVS